MAKKRALSRKRSIPSQKTIKNKWKDLSLYKQGLILIVTAFFLYHVTANLNIVTTFARRFLNVLAPFMIGCVIAYFLSRPVIKLDEKFSKSKSALVRKKSHVLATLTVFLVVIATATVIVSHVSPIIVGNLRDFIDNLPTYYENVLDWIRNLGSDNLLYGFLPEIPDDNVDVPAELLGAVLPDAEVMMEAGFINLLTTALDTIVSNIVSFGTSLINFALGLVIALYLLLHRTTVIALVNRIATVFIKPKTLKFLGEYLHKSNDIFYQFISAQFLDACILGTLSFFLLLGLRALGVGVEYAMTLALLLGICNMIPFFGSIFASLVTTVITLFTGGPQDALIVLGALLVLQQIDANFISPKITGDVLGLNPLLIITSIFIGNEFLGIFGMFIAVPVAAMCKIFLEDYLILREKKLGIRTKS